MFCNRRVFVSFSIKFIIWQIYFILICLKNTFHVDNTFAYYINAFKFGYIKDDDDDEDTVDDDDNMFLVNAEKTMINYFSTFACNNSIYNG